MCIAPVPAYPYGRKLFWTELEAITAELRDIADDIKRNHASDPQPALVQHADRLVPLLARHAVLAAGADNTVAESLEGTPAEGPEGTREDRVSAIIGEMQGQQSTAKSWLTRHGFTDLRDFTDRATDADLDKWDSREKEAA